MRKLILALFIAVYATFSTMDCIAADNANTFFVDLNEPAPKLTFRQKHPKISKAIRKFRYVCHFCTPIIQCTGSVAQTLLLFI